jgi:hypothetical protein
MSTQSNKTDYNPQLAERVVTLIESRGDARVFQELGGASSAIRAEAIREFLWRKDAAGSNAAREILQKSDLLPEELRTVFTAAAESGDTKMLRLICRLSPEAIDSESIRSALVGALHKKETESIAWIADTELLPPQVKQRAITPSLFRSCDERRSDKRARDELGTAETIITKQFRDAQHELRHARRQRRLAAMVPSGEEKRQRRIERKFSHLLRATTNQIRAHRQKLAEPLFGHALREHAEITTMLIEQVTREIARQREIALTTPPALKEKHSSRAADVSTWRGTNPKGHEDSPSFAEMLEKFFRKSKSESASGPSTFSDFIDTVLDAWGSETRPLSRENLCKLIEERHPRKETLSNKALYDWKNHPEYSPLTDSLTIIADAFQLNKLHELIMFRIARGRPCEDLEDLLAAAERAIRTPDEKKTRGELFAALCDASGVPLVVLAQRLAVSQISLWKRGQRIEDPAMASRLVNLVNPPALYPKELRQEVREFNSRVQAALGGRQSSVLDAVFLAERSGVANPGGLLFSLLISRRGLSPLNSDAAAKILNVTPSKVRHMSACSDRRGGEITETLAMTLLDHIQGVSETTRHLLSPIQRAEREIALDTLTLVPSPVRLMSQVLRGELSHVGEVHRLTRQRRGVLQESGMSDFELGKAGLNHPRAAAVADWLGFTDPQRRECRRLFIAMATGTYTPETPSEILDEIIAGKVERHIGLQKLFDWTGLTRAELSAKMGATKSSGNTYTTAQRAGRIFNQNHLRIVAEELGLRHRFDELVSVFTPKKYTPPTH